MFSVQKLHLVGFTTDHKSLILSARRGARSGGFVLDVDSDLGAAVVAALESAPAPVDEVEEIEPVGPPKPQSALSVRELQARLRSGRTLESVANEAGVDVEWVTRFAAPVLAEQARVIEATRGATYSRARLGPSALKLGPSVYRNLAAKGITLTAEELDRGWTTRQLSDGRWVVTFTYVSRGKRQKPAWELDLRTGEVKARDRLAGELSFVPGAPRPASPKAAPTKPVKVPASAPTELDHVNAKRVAAARKAAEAQLAEAARRSTRRSADVAKRANTPKAAAERARKRAVAAAAAEVEAAERLAAAVEPTPGPAVAASDAVPAAPILVTAEDVATGRVEDPAVSAVAMVREAAQALLSDFASGRLLDDDSSEPGVDDSAMKTWDDVAVDEAWAVEGGEELVTAGDLFEEVDEEAEPLDEEELTGHDADDDVVEPPAPIVVVGGPAVSPVPTRRRPAAPTPAPAPAVPSRSLTAATPAPIATAPETGRRLRLRREEKVVRTPIDLDDVVVAPARRGPAFRDDLAVPARRNGAAAEVPDDFADLRGDDDDLLDDVDVPPAPSRPAPRRRRTEPLRAR